LTILVLYSRLALTTEQVKTADQDIHQRCLTRQLQLRPGHFSNWG